MNRVTYKILPVFQTGLRKAFESLGSFQVRGEQNCLYRLDFNTPQGWLRVKQFSNGTLYLEATHGGLFQQAQTLVTEITQSQAAPSKQSVSSSSSINGKIEVSQPYIGTDESGKGDYFGPLVIAGVYATPDQEAALKAFGVQDSKALTDGRIHTIASQIRSTVGESSIAVIELTPKRYNELYDQFKAQGKNLNHMLAWGHAAMIETLLENNPTCQLAIADQFGSEHYIQSQLKTLGKQIKLHQTPKAEANIAVAAASIIARECFVSLLKELGKPFGITLPLGAGDQTLRVARQFVAQHGANQLKLVAKLHFKTTQAVL